MLCAVSAWLLLRSWEYPAAAQTDTATMRASIDSLRGAAPAAIRVPPAPAARELRAGQTAPGDLEPASASQRQAVEASARRPGRSVEVLVTPRDGARSLAVATDRDPEGDHESAESFVVTVFRPDTGAPLASAALTPASFETEDAASPRPATLDFRNLPSGPLLASLHAATADPRRGYLERIEIPVTDRSVEITASAPRTHQVVLRQPDSGSANGEWPTITISLRREADPAWFPPADVVPRILPRNPEDGRSERTFAVGPLGSGTFLLTLDGLREVGADGDGDESGLTIRLQPEDAATPQAVIVEAIR